MRGRIGSAVGPLRGRPRLASPEEEIQDEALLSRYPSRMSGRRPHELFQAHGHGEHDRVTPPERLDCIPDAPRGTQDLRLQ